jgi:hypothetical protein
MSHHYAGVDFGFPQSDGRLNFCDLYAFPKPGDPNKSILITDVHPAIGLNPKGPTATEPFAPEVIYELKIDTNGDAVADIAYRFQFLQSDSGTQTATVRRVEGPDAAGMDGGGRVIFEGAPVSNGSDPQITQADEYRLFAGWRSDPFFFDTTGALNDLQFTGDDFFADRDVCSIVLELPNSDLGDGKVDLWHRTLAPTDNDAHWIQVERGARTQQVPFLVPNEEKAAYAGTEPTDDARFLKGIAHSLEHAGGYSPAEAEQIAGTMLPDVMPYDPARRIAYPDNGRLLNEDVVDPFLVILTNGRVKGDGVGPHQDLLPEFPFLGPPHDNRTGA